MLAAFVFQDSDFFVGVSVPAGLLSDASEAHQEAVRYDMKYRLLGIIAGLITILAAFMPGPVRSFLLRKVKTVLYLIFG